MAMRRAALLLLAALVALAAPAGADGDDSYRVKFTVAVSPTEKGDFILEVHPAWAPLGAARFKELLDANFYEGVRFFRVINHFMAQFGIHGDPRVGDQWRGKKIEDDPVLQSNRRGTISFASAGPGTRTTQMFINFVDNRRLDKMGFSPFAQVTEGMDTVDRIYAGYGEGAPSGRGPRQSKCHKLGNEYLEKEFPKLSYIISASLL